MRSGDKSKKISPSVNMLMGLLSYAEIGLA